MDLSNYLQMPPAPQSPAPAGTSSAPAAASLTGVDASGRFKLDFARIMAQQFQQLPSVKRQDLAALSASSAGGVAHTDPRRTSAGTGDTRAQDTSADAEDRRHTASGSGESMASTRASLLARTGPAASARSGNPAPSARGRTSAEHDTREASSDATDDPNTGDPRSTKVTTRRSALQPAAQTVDGLGGWGNASSASSTPSSVDPSAPILAGAAWHPDMTDSAALSLPDGTQLQSVALSPEVQIVTDPSHAPTPQSLLNFARSMGLDDASLRQLVGDGQGLAGQTWNVSAHSQTLAAGAPGGASATWWLAAQQIQMQIQTTGAPGAPDTAAMLPGGAQWLQSGLLPVAPAATNASSGTVTLDVLTLSGADLPQAQITALAESFLAGDDASGSSSGGETAQNGQPGLAPAPAASTGPSATAAQDTNASTATRPMAEVYQQLSDKLSSEMAARMHRQISAGEWKMKFGLRPAHLGSVEIQLEMKDGKLHADLAADNPLTRELLQNGSQRLRESLANLGIQAERVSVGQGQTWFGQGQGGAQGQGASQRGQVEDNSGPSSPAQTAISEPVRTSPKDPDALLDLYA